MSGEGILKNINVGRIVILLLTAAVLLLVSKISDHTFWKAATHEVGFAVLVSAVIWLMFEGQLRQEAEEVWDRRIEHATRNVFQAVLRKDLPKALLDEANNLVLNSLLVRTDFAVTYTLRDACFETGGRERAECVLVDALMEFSMENVSTQEVAWNSGLRLPNPVHPGMKDAVKVHRFDVWKGDEPVLLNLKKATEDFRREIGNNERTAISFDPGPVVLKPGEKCRCSASYTMAKEVEDSEILQTLHPANGVRVTVFDQAGDQRRIVLARSVHREDLKIERSPTETGSAQIFRIPAYLLPHQGVLIWWKRNPGLDGAPALPLREHQAGATQVRIEGAGNADQQHAR